MLEIVNGGFAVKDKWLARNISYSFQPGKTYMLCGPNGAGKSTLMKLLSLQLQTSEGEVRYNGSVVSNRHKSEYAKFRGVLSQQVDISFPLTVREVVMMGRYPHFDVRPAKRDLEICDEAMHLLQITQFSERNFLTLSGGEKQRVQFARVLTQIWEPPAEGCRMLLLDEPVSALDLKYQFDFLHTLEAFMNEKTIIISILHDFNLVINYSDEVLLMSNGKLFAAGNPKEVLSPANIEEVFHIKTALHAVGNDHLIWIK
jgi:iron complex transport system ATP-binding protein